MIACVDGGLLCGPILFVVVSTVLGWLGYRRCRRRSCECHDLPLTPHLPEDPIDAPHLTPAERDELLRFLGLPQRQNVDHG